MRANFFYDIMWIDDICSIEHDEAFSGTVPQAHTLVPPATTRTQSMAETSKSVRRILEKIRDDAQHALSFSRWFISALLIGHFDSASDRSRARLKALNQSPRIWRTWLSSGGPSKNISRIDSRSFERSATRSAGGCSRSVPLFAVE